MAALKLLTVLIIAGKYMRNIQGSALFLVTIIIGLSNFKILTSALIDCLYNFISRCCSGRPAQAGRVL